MNVCIHYPLEPTRDCTKGPLHNSNLFLKPLIPSELEKTKTKQCTVLAGRGCWGQLGSIVLRFCFHEYQLFLDNHFSGTPEAPKTLSRQI